MRVGVGNEAKFWGGAVRAAGANASAIGKPALAAATRGRRVGGSLCCRGGGAGNDKQSQCVWGRMGDRFFWERSLWGNVRVRAL